MNPKLRQLVPAFALLAVGLIALGAAWYVTLSRGTEVAGSAIVEKFSLVDDEGRPVTEADYAGRPHLVFFGFTHCPDVCPTTLYELSTVMEALGDDAEKVEVLLISVDPARDTKDVLKDYVSSFGPRFTGLTGSQEAVDAAVKNFKAYYRKVPLDGGDYTIDHTAVVYLFDGKGNFVGPFNYKRPAEESAAELRKLL